MKTKLVIALSVTVVALLAGASSAKIVGKSKYRKVKRGVGNCIFSGQELPFERDRSYKDIRAKFKTGDVVHARCYWPTQLKDYVSKGKRTNLLREKRAAYRTSLDVRSIKKPKKKGETPMELDRLIAPSRLEGSEVWDQREYSFDPQNAGKCSFKSHMGVGCLDLDKAVDLLSKMDATPERPYTAEVCVRTYIEYSDETAMVVDKETGKKVEGEKTITEELSKGCFKYTIE